MGKEAKIVLSGGGARGFAHIGVLIGLYELGIKPIAISGTSAGSLIGAFLADGFHPLEIKELFCEHKFAKNIRFMDLKSGIFSSDSIYDLLNLHLRSKLFSGLQTPLFVTATNLLSGDRTVFSEGKIIETVVASCSIPLLLPPVYINGIPYVDGGVTSNLPVEPFLPLTNELIIGVNVNPIPPYSKETGIIDTIDRTMQLCLKENVEQNATFCNVFIEPKGIEKYKLMDNEHIVEIIDLGYEHIKSIAHQLTLL